MSALPKRYFTQEEYALLESKATYKSQYVAGEIFAMAGAQPAHLEISSNIAGMLYVRFRGRPCRAYVADARVRVRAGELWTYPDLAALCGEPSFETFQRPYSLLNPQVIFEVLSPSTDEFDRGDKFARYQKLESLTDYVLISAETVRIDHFNRHADGSWIFRQYDQPGHVLTLASVSADLPLAEIYERVQFLEEESDG